MFPRGVTKCDIATAVSKQPYNSPFRQYWDCDQDRRAKRRKHPTHSESTSKNGVTHVRASFLLLPLRDFLSNLLFNVKLAKLGKSPLVRDIGRVQSNIKQGWKVYAKKSLADSRKKERLAEVVFEIFFCWWRNHRPIINSCT